MTNNKEVKIITQAFKFLEKNIELVADTLPFLFNNKNVVTITKAVAHCLALRIHIDKAEKILEDAANDDQNVIFGFNAQMRFAIEAGGES